MFMRGKKKPLKMLIEDDDGPTFIEWFRGMNRGHDIRFDRLLGLGHFPWTRTRHTESEPAEPSPKPSPKF